MERVKMVLLTVSFRVANDVSLLEVMGHAWP